MNEGCTKKRVKTRPNFSFGG